LIVIKNELGPGLLKFEKLSSQLMETAKVKMALQLLNWIVNGKAPSPPILEGTLRGSGSCFVGNKHIGSLPSYDNREANTSHSAPSNTITVGFNVSYAAKMHETDWSPGPVSRKDPKVGNKFIEKHLQSDGDDLMKMAAIILKDGLK
jgi:hypothetical protein